MALRAHVRFTTLIVLPATEQILEVTCGDKDLWLVNAAQHLASVKPARPGSETNLNLLTASGAVYSFVLTEVSALSGVRPDLKVYIERKDGDGDGGGVRRPLFVSTQQVEEFRVQAELAREDAHRAREQAQANEEGARHAASDAKVRFDRELSAYRATYPTTLRFPYAYTAGRKPFLVTAIFHDDTCTYIQAGATELSAVYELTESGPSLVTFEYRHGTYVVPKVLDAGYLAIGNARFLFKRTR